MLRRRFRAACLVPAFAAVWAATVNTHLAAEPGETGDGPAASFDVVVYGGTPAGVMAAVEAARHQASVILLEQKRHVGGLTTSGLCNDEAHNMDYRTITGLALEFYQRLAEAGGREPPEELWRKRRMNTWHSSVAQKVFDRMLAEARVPVRFGQRVDKAIKDEATIREIVMRDGSRVRGRVFLDCTYEGDLLARTGVSYTWGRESTEKYGESLAGVRLGDREYKAMTRDGEGNLLPGISAARDQLTPGQRDHKVQNYNFRLTLTKDRSQQVPFPQPKRYDPRRYALLASFLNDRPKTSFKDIVACWPIGGGKYEANNHQNAIISLGHFGGQFDYPDADYAGQDRIYQDHVDYTQGLFWFLLHDPAVPVPLREQTAAWGLAADEFTDNGHWPYYLYIREARRMIGPYVMTQKDVREDLEKPDAVLLGSHRVDAHHVQRVAVSNEAFTNEGRLWLAGKVYEVPYRALTPNRSECENLLVPVCSSFSHVAFCTYRLEPTWMGAGQVAGLAAAEAGKRGVPVQDVDAARLQAQLAKEGVRYKRTPEP